MPYLIQTLREYDAKMSQIYSKFAAQDKEKEDKEKEDKEKAQSDVGVSAVFNPGAILSIMPPPGMMPGLGGYPAYPPPGAGGFFG